MSLYLTSNFASQDLKNKHCIQTLVNLSCQPNLLSKGSTFIQATLSPLQLQPRISCHEFLLSTTTPLQLAYDCQQQPQYGSKSTLADAQFLLILLHLHYCCPEFLPSATALTFAESQDDATLVNLLQSRISCPAVLPSATTLPASRQDVATLATWATNKNQLPPTSQDFLAQLQATANIECCIVQHIRREMPQKRRNVMDSTILTEIEQSKIIQTATSYEIQHPDIVPAWRDRMNHNSQVCMILLLCMLLVIILH